MEKQKVNTAILWDFFKAHFPADWYVPKHYRLTIFLSASLSILDFLD